MLRLLRPGAVVLPLLLTACVNSHPYTMPSQYQPPANTRAPAAGMAACSVHLGEVADLRSDAHAMGAAGGRTVLMDDAAGWVRSGLQTLGNEPGIRLDDSKPDLTLRAELLKAYVMSVTSLTRSASVVIRITYVHDGAEPWQAIYRGTTDNVNWADGAKESLSSFNNALAQALKAIATDIRARCTG